MANILRRVGRKLKSLVPRARDTLKHKPLAWYLTTFKSQTEDAARQATITKEDAETIIPWALANRAEKPALHIGDSGNRESTVTGVHWLDNVTLLANHQYGRRVAVFDVSRPGAPSAEADTVHLTDAVAAYPVGADTWNVIMSGCWNVLYRRYELKRDRGFTFTLKEDVDHVTRDFSHGVSFTPDGKPCYTTSTGVDMRIQIGEKTHRLPHPWGPRDVAYDKERKRYMAIAVNSQPRQSGAYGGVQASLWVLSDGASRWQPLALYDNVHSDSLEFWGGMVWLPDQVKNRLMAVNAETGAVEYIFSGDAFDFPHGLAVSGDNRIAVTNYGQSNIVVLKLEDLVARA